VKIQKNVGVKIAEGQPCQICIDDIKHLNNVRRLRQNETLTEMRFSHVTQHTHTQPFYGSVEFVRDNPGESVPEETKHKVTEIDYIAVTYRKPFYIVVCIKFCIFPSQRSRI